MLIAFLWLNTVIAREIWQRRRPIEISSSSTKLASNTINAMVANNHISHNTAVTSSSGNDESIDKRTSETNTISNDNNGGKSMKVESKCRYLASVSYGKIQNNNPFFLVPPMNTQNARRSMSAAISNPTKSTREIRQLRMFRAILVIMITFFVCRLPTWIFLLYKLFNVANTNFHWMLQYTFGLLSIFNCVLNPLLYTYLTETINCSFLLIENLKSLYCCCFCWGTPKRQHQENDLLDRTRNNSPAGVADVAMTTTMIAPAASCLPAGDVESHVVKKSSFYFSEDNKTKLARND